MFVERPDTIIKLIDMLMHRLSLVHGLTDYDPRKLRSSAPKLEELRVCIYICMYMHVPSLRVDGT